MHVITEHFNAIVAENCMKCEEIHPKRIGMILHYPTHLSILEHH